MPDANIRDCFTKLDHEWLGKFLRHRIADELALRLISKWLTAGVVDDGQRATRAHRRAGYVRLHITRPAARVTDR